MTKYLIFHDDYHASTSSLDGSKMDRSQVVIVRLWNYFPQGGDAVQTYYEGLSAFYVDERFQMPGTWDFEFACQFCEQIAFNQLTKLHYQVWQSEPNCFEISNYILLENE